MSHSIMVPVTGQGTVVDQNVATYLPQLLQSQFGFSDIFLYSHGWWTTALSAMVDYSRFSVGMLEQIIRLATAGAVRPPSALQIGIHWPAAISEEGDSIISVLQPLTFYNRGAMAEDVGEHAGAAILKLLIEAAQAGTRLRIHLIGHSFGCRVVCSTLESVTKNVDPESLAPHQFNIVLLQGALDSDGLEPQNGYGNILDPAKGLANVRTLITKSALDKAVGTAYPEAYRLVHLFGKRTTGIGATGPSVGTPGAQNALALNIGPGFVPPTNLNASNFVVADLTPLHQYRVTNHEYPSDGASGSHSDIYVDEIYNLVAGFLL